MKSFSPLVAVIIVTFNNREWLEKSIPSLIKQTYPNLDIVVVDNDSLDNASEFVEKRYPDVKVVKCNQNMGFGAGCNEGSRTTKAKYLLFCNEDMIFEKDYVEKLVGVMEEDELVGACQGTTYEYRNKNKIQSIGLMFNLTGMLESPSKKTIKREKTMEIFAATAPLLVRKSIYDIVKGFDEDFFLYFEEVDLCWRIRLLGNRVVCVFQAKVLHKGGVSTNKLPPQEIVEYIVRNRLQSYLVNLGIVNLLVALPLQVLMGVFSAVILLLQTKVALSLAVIRGLVWNLWHLPHLIVKRNEVQGYRVDADSEFLKQVSGEFPMDKMLFLAGLRSKV